MAIKILVANGCSYTRGAELADPSHEAWPAVLAGRLGVPVVNLASDGGSNRRIVRTTVENLARVCAEHGVTPADSLVVCMWTGLARAEHRRPGRPDQGNRPDLPYETDWHRLGRWRVAERHRASAAYFRHLWDEGGAAVDVLLDWLLLDAHLRSAGATARYCFAWDVLPGRLPAEAAGLLARLDPTTVHGGAVDSGRASFYGSVAGTHPTGTLYHPLAAAHTAYAEELSAWLRAVPAETR
jgi:hypothetical protein